MPEVVDTSKQKRDKIVFWLNVVGLIGTLFFLLLLGLSYSNIKLDANAGYETYGEFNRGTNYDTDIILDDNETYVLQRYDVPQDYNIGYEFCYNLRVNGSDGVRIVIVNDLGFPLGTEFLLNTTTHYCTELVFLKDLTLGSTFKDNKVVYSSASAYEDYNLDPIRKQNYLGIQCLNCDASNKIILYGELVGERVNQITFDSGDYTVSRERTLSQELIGKKSYKTLAKLWVISYFTLTALLFFMLFIFVGWDLMRQFFIEDMERRMQ